MASASGAQPTYGYAPVRGAYFVHAGSKISAYEEVKLSTTSSEQDLNESLAEIYGILVTLDAVEKCYMRDSLSDTEYADACSRLLMQYRSFLAGEAVRLAFRDIDSFQADWGFECPRAKERIRVGVPATMAAFTGLSSDGAGGQSSVSPAMLSPAGQSTPRNTSPAGIEPGSSSSAAGGLSAVGPTSTSSTLGTGESVASAARSATSTTTVTPALVVAATENFITLLDAIQMGMVEKDVLHPLLRDIIQSANKVADDFESKGKIVEWLITLNRMGAAERLAEDQSRQFDFDMKQAYHGFKSRLSQSRS